MKDPAIHSHVTDSLPDEHPLAYEHTFCAKCNCLLHSGNNECMTTWAETGRGCYCLQCFNFLVIHAGGVLDDDWGLPDTGVINIEEDCDHVWFDANNEHMLNTAMCARCGMVELLNNVEPSDDMELIRACLKARGEDTFEGVAA